MGRHFSAALSRTRKPTYPLNGKPITATISPPLPSLMPSSTIRSISITVSDDDGAAAGPRRIRAGRRKAARSLGQRAVRLLARWWPVLLLLPAIALLLFEASRLSSSPALAPPVSSLGRLDPTTRLVHGVRKREYSSLLLFDLTHEVFLNCPDPCGYEDVYCGLHNRNSLSW
jgi:hypothetical protein